MSKHPDHILHPTYGRPLSGAARTISGVLLRPYRTGIGTSAWISDDFRISLWSYNWRQTYTVSVDGQNLGKKFRQEKTAMAAAAKIAYANKAEG